MLTPEDRPCVAIVGLGNIGARHLQGLSSIASIIDLVGIEPNTKSREAAEVEWHRLSGRGKFQPNVSAFKSAEIVIIATAARTRLELFRQAIALSPRHIVLEKVVFQREEDFDSALLESMSRNVLVYVNCPRRVWPIYKYIKGLVQEEGFVGVGVRGRNIGLACNSVHYIDLFQFIAGECNIDAISDDMGEIVESKRSGYYECFGRMEFVTPSGCKLLVSVTPDDAENTTIEIETSRRKISIDEAAGIVTDSGSGEIIVNVGRPPYQSELSGDVISSLIRGQDCGLATLRESSMAHAPFLKILRRHFERAGMDLSDGVPIT